MREDYKERIDLFCEVLKKIKDGMSITFTPDNVDENDDFLIFSAYKKIKATFKRTYSGVIGVRFDCDEPMLLENCPTSFFRSILKNIK